MISSTRAPLVTRLLLLQTRPVSELTGCLRWCVLSPGSLKLNSVPTDWQLHNSVMRPTDGVPFADWTSRHILPICLLSSGGSWHCNGHFLQIQCRCKVYVRLYLKLLANLLWHHLCLYTYEWVSLIEVTMAADGAVNSIL